MVVRPTRPPCPVLLLLEADKVVEEEEEDEEEEERIDELAGLLLEAVAVWDWERRMGGR